MINLSELIACEKGHYYDPKKNRTCPYCGQMGAVGATTPLAVNLTPGPVSNGNKPDVKHKKPIADDVGMTIRYYEEMESNPVVGWLVSIEGSTVGKDFRLCSGRNYIGRAKDMDVVLEGDNRVSRNKHAIVLFDPKSQKTMCQAGESRELFYLNDNVVTETAELKRGDVITIGDTKLMFVPFCGDLHNWDTKEVF